MDVRHVLTITEGDTQGDRVSLMSRDDVSKRSDRGGIDLAGSVVMQGQGNAGLSLRSHQHREGVVHRSGS